MSAEIKAGRVSSTLGFKAINAIQLVKFNVKHGFCDTPYGGCLLGTQSSRDQLERADAGHTNRTYMHYI